MAATSQPLTLRLPFAMVDRHLRLEQILAADPDRSWAHSWPLVACFALSRPEMQFARRLLEQKRNFWLFRSNQRRFCGDFVAVDMSAARPRLRSVTVIELKSGADLRLDGGGAGNQLQKAREAVAELARTEGLIAPDTTVTLASGDGEAVLEWIATKRHFAHKTT